MDEYPFPAPHDFTHRLKSIYHPLAEISAMPPAGALEYLRDAWSAIHVPVLQKLRDRILSTPLLGLSATEHGEHWLTFAETNAEQRISIPGIVHPQPEIEFPINSIPGLSEFFRFFAGVTDWSYLPPGSCFLMPSEFVVVRSNDQKYDWGNIEGWEGSMTIYHGGTGDHLIIRPDGAVGSWSHDVGWESDEPAVSKGTDSFLELVERYIDYLNMVPDSEEKRESLFYY